MTLKVELNAKVEAGLMAQAEARGLSLEAYVSRVLEERSGLHSEGKRHPSGKSIVDLFAPLKGLEVEFKRNESTGRPIENALVETMNPQWRDLSAGWYKELKVPPQPPPGAGACLGMTNCFGASALNEIPHDELDTERRGCLSRH